MTHDNPAGYPADAPPMTMTQARMLDLRTYICGLFAIFGITVTIAGIFADPVQLQKAAGMNINLFAGIAMLVLSVVMGVWAILVPPDISTTSDDLTEPPQVD